MGLCELLTCGSLVVADEEHCGGVLDSLMRRCSSYLEIPGLVFLPSNNRCYAIRRADMPFFCKLDALLVEYIVNRPKLVFIAMECGKPLPPKSKCGSKPASFAIYTLAFAPGPLCKIVVDG